VACVGQTGRDLKTHCKEVSMYIKTNNPKSAYVLHILNNRHKYGAMLTTSLLVKHAKKSKVLNCWENFYIQSFNHQGQWIQKQTVYDHNCYTLWFKLITWSMRKNMSATYLHQLLVRLELTYLAQLHNKIDINICLHPLGATRFSRNCRKLLKRHQFDTFHVHWTFYSL